MSTSESVKSKHQRAYVPATALAKSVEFDDDMMQVAFTDGRILSGPWRGFRRSTSRRRSSVVATRSGGRRGAALAGLG
jgi:hypothetical protein